MDMRGGEVQPDEDTSLPTLMADIPIPNVVLDKELPLAELAHQTKEGSSSQATNRVESLPASSGAIIPTENTSDAPHPHDMGQSSGNEQLMPDATTEAQDGHLFEEAAAQSTSAEQQAPLAPQLLHKAPTSLPPSNIPALNPQGAHICPLQAPPYLFGNSTLLLCFTPPVGCEPRNGSVIIELACFSEPVRLKAGPAHTKQHNLIVGHII